MPKFVQRDQSQLFLLPPDLRAWLPSDALAHCVVEAVERVPMESFTVNERGTGSAQYHPRMMLALLVYCYANGIFGSRRIERATYRDIGVRYVALNCHPDHDTICTFRRSNFDAVAEAFVQVLLLAKELKRLRGEIEDLLGRADRADAEETPDPQRLPEELSRREQLRAKLDNACLELERRGKARAAAERSEYERRVAARERRADRKGRKIKTLREEPKDSEQINLTDADSALMRKSKRHEYRQAYNAQAVADAGGSQLVLGGRVSACASDRNELVADVNAMPGVLGTADRVLANSGDATGSEVAQLRGRGMQVRVATGAEGNRRRHDCRPEAPKKTANEPQAEWLKSMRETMALAENRAHYRLCKQTVEPVFGIVKQAMGFRQFLLRGLEKVEGEWALVARAYNCRRLNNMRLA